MSGRYLVTGVAGSGKSTLEKEFRKRGYITVDVDDGYTEWRHADTDEVLPYEPDNEAWHEKAEWVVNVGKLQSFFDSHPDENVLVFGSFARMKTVTPLFTKIFLLEYSDEKTVLERIAGREGGYGKSPHELKLILSYVEPYQEKMRAAGAIPIDCTLGMEQKIAMIEAKLQSGS